MASPFVLLLLAMALSRARGDSGGCDYECSSDGSCKLHLTGNLQENFLGPGIHHIPRCKPCAEMCGEQEGFVGGHRWADEPRPPGRDR